MTKGRAALTVYSAARVESASWGFCGSHPSQKKSEGWGTRRLVAQWALSESLELNKVTGSRDDKGRAVLPSGTASRFSTASNAFPTSSRVGANEVRIFARSLNGEAV